MHRDGRIPCKGEELKSLLAIKVTDSERNELLDIIEGKLLLGIANKILKEGAERDFLINQESHEKVKKYHHWLETHKALKIRTEQSLQ